jgi:alkyl hydroperoxide reductase subunit AhpC
MLADFHPKGAVATSYGVYHDDKGITDRATIIIDTNGVVRYANSVGIPGLRSAADLLAECQKVAG